MEQLVQNEEDAIWAARNEHWLKRQTRPSQYRSKRERERRPLILCGHGVHLKIDKGTLLIRDGFTHFPQERKEYRFFKGSLALPPRIVMVDGNGSLSFDVMSWLSEQDIALVRLDYQGNALSVLGNGGYAGDPQRVQWQMETRNDPALRQAFCRDLIEQKLTGCRKTLSEIAPAREAKTVAIVAIENALSQLKGNSATTIDDIRMIEARAAARYFAAWKGLPLKWRSEWKHPIPGEWQTIPQRGSLNNRTYVRNRHAKHPFNAMLNYAYGMMYSAVQIGAVAEGYDPRRGVMHVDRDDAFAWVLDAVESSRPTYDAKFFKFVLGSEFTGADFTLNSAGVCRVSPQLAKAIAGQFS